jgi:hypothetical protein
MPSSSHVAVTPVAQNLHRPQAHLGFDHIDLRNTRSATDRIRPDLAKLDAADSTLRDKFGQLLDRILYRHLRAHAIHAEDIDRLLAIYDLIGIGNELAHAFGEATKGKCSHVHDATLDTYHDLAGIFWVRREVLVE